MDDRIDGEGRRKAWASRVVGGQAGGISHRRGGPWPAFLRGSLLLAVLVACQAAPERTAGSGGPGSSPGAAGAGEAPAAEASVRPGINDAYQDPDVAQWIERFERPGREIFDRRATIVDALGLRPGMDVADVGAGTGLFEPLLARRVAPGGKVFAVDLVPAFLDHIRRRCQEGGITNVATVRGTERSIELPEASIDVAFLCDVYHHLEYPRSTLGSIRRALRPGGTLVVIDFERVEGESSAWVLGHVRAGREEVSREIEAAGFARAGSCDVLETNYFLRFRPR